MGIRLEVRTQEAKWLKAPDGFHSGDERETEVIDFCERHSIPYSREFVSVWAMPSDSSQVKQIGAGRAVWIARNADAYGKEIIVLGEHVVDCLALVACGDFQNIILEAADLEKAGNDVDHYLQEMLFIFTPATPHAERVARLEAASEKARQLIARGDAETRLLRRLIGSDLRTAQIWLGTSSFTASGWEGSFYPRGLKSTDYLAYYAEHFDSVEVDSTFYACPTPKTVSGWFAKTPDNFIFAVKVPQTITHEKVLVDCEAEWKEFLDTMSILQQKLGPIVFQFPYFNHAAFRDREPFLQRLVPFLKKLPKDHKFAIELRNKDWLDCDLNFVLKQLQVALVLQDRSWMADPLSFKFDPITAGFTYIRWLGNRKEIEAMVQSWDKVVVDRDDELKSWVDFVFRAIE